MSQHWTRWARGDDAQPARCSLWHRVAHRWLTASMVGSEGRGQGVAHCASRKAILPLYYNIRAIQGRHTCTFLVPVHSEPPTPTATTWPSIRSWHGSQLRLRRHAERRHLPNRVLRLTLDAPEEDLAARAVRDEPHDDARGPYARVGVADLVHAAAALARDELAHVLELGAAGAPLERDDLLRDRVLVHARGVVHRAEDVRRVALGGGDDLVFDVLVDRAAAGEEGEK